MARTEKNDHSKEGREGGFVAFLITKYLKSPTLAEG